MHYEKAKVGRGGCFTGNISKYVPQQRKVVRMANGVIVKKYFVVCMYIRFRVIGQNGFRRLIKIREKKYELSFKNAELNFAEKPVEFISSKAVVLHQSRQLSFHPKKSQTHWRSYSNDGGEAAESAARRATKQSRSAS